MTDDDKPMLVVVKAQDNLLTPEHLVQRYHGALTLRTLRNWRTTNDGPPWIKVGGKVFYSLEAVRDWERKRTLGTRGK